MGAEIGVGALLAASGISTLGNIAGSAISSSGANSANSQLMAFNSQEAEKNRQFQRDMYNQQLSDQERMYNQYQSPEAIAKQLQSIGLNPSAVLGKGSGFQSMGSVPGVSSGSQASVGSLLNPNASYGDALKNTTKDAVSVLNSLTDKHLKDSQTIKVLAEAKGQEYANQIAKIQSQVSEWQIPQKAKAEISNLITSSALNEARGELTKAESDLKKLTQLLTDKQIRLTDEQIQQLTIEVAWLDRIRKQEYDLLGEKQKTERSQQAVNYGSANEHNANAKTINDIRADVVRYHKYVANIHETKDFVSSNTAWNEVQQSLYDLQASKLVPNQIVLAIEHAKKANDWYEVNELLGIVDEGVKAYGTYYGAKTGKGFVDAQNTSNRIKQDYNDYLKSKDNHPRTYTPDAPWNTRWR